MIIPPSTSQRRVLGSWDGFLKEATPGILVQMVPLRSRPDQVPVMLAKPDSEARRLAQLVGEREIGEAIDATTEHAWLVVLGHLAQVLGLVAGLAGVPLGQRQGAKHTPQSKVIEFLVGILGDIDYLQDLNLGARPIASDATIAQAWAQELFAHYSGVSRTLEAADEETLAAVVEVLRTVSRPLIQVAVLEAIKQRGHLTVDVDLTGRQVSPTSTDYPEADFGWMDDEVSKGYQAAITSLVCHRWQRLLVTLQRYSGRTQSADCLQAAVQEVEDVLGVRPRRRVELVYARRQVVMEQMQRLQACLDTDNRANPNPVSVVLRVDAGFSTGPNLAWLIEMGCARPTPTLSPRLIRSKTWYALSLTHGHAGYAIPSLQEDAAEKLDTLLQ